MSQHSKLVPLADRGPLRVMFVLSSMPVGGAETLLVNLVRRMDRERFTPQVCCLQELGPLGEVLSAEIPTFANMIRGKYDPGVLLRLMRLYRQQRVDAVVTVGAGDKMFWGRIAARMAGVPVICSALHSTGWPDVIERPNRWRLLTWWTDAFIGVATQHGRHLIDGEGFPAAKVHVIPNGVDIARFCEPHDRTAVRRALGVSQCTPLVGIVAALRPEKNHALLLNAIAQVRRQVPGAELLIVGDGPMRADLEQRASQLGLDEAVHFLGNRPDIPEILAAIDVFVLTSKMEANPVSILEAMASGKPVVAPNVGSIAETVSNGETGFLTEPSDEAQVVSRIVQLLRDPTLAESIGQKGRETVTERWSLEQMVDGYQQLLSEIYDRKANQSRATALPNSTRELAPTHAGIAS